jgi:hypothetical protein
VDLGFLNTSSQVAGQLEAQVQVGPVGTVVQVTSPQSVPVSAITDGGGITAP